MTAALAVAAFIAFAAAVILAAFNCSERRYSNQIYAAFQKECAKTEALKKQLAAATSALLTDLDDLTPEDFR